MAISYPLGSGCFVEEDELVRLILSYPDIEASSKLRVLFNYDTFYPLSRNIKVLEYIPADRLIKDFDTELVKKNLVDLY